MFVNVLSLHPVTCVSVFLIAIVILSFPVCVGKGTTFFRRLQVPTGETLGETTHDPSFPPFSLGRLAKKAYLCRQNETYTVFVNLRRRPPADPPLRLHQP